MASSAVMAFADTTVMTKIADDAADKAYAFRLYSERASVTEVARRMATDKWHAARWFAEWNRVTEVAGA